MICPAIPLVAIVAALPIKAGADLMWFGERKTHAGRLFTNSIKGVKTTFPKPPETNPL